MEIPGNSCTVTNHIMHITIVEYNQFTLGYVSNMGHRIPRYTMKLGNVYWMIGFWYGTQNTTVYHEIGKRLFKALLPDWSITIYHNSWIVWVFFCCIRCVTGCKMWPITHLRNNVKLKSSYARHSWVRCAPSALIIMLTGTRVGLKKNIRTVWSVGT